MNKLGEILTRHPWIEFIPYKSESYLLKLADYLGEINIQHNQRVTRQVYWVIWFQVGHAFRSLMLAIFDLTPVQRFGLFDYQHLLQLEPRLGNLLLVAPYFMTGYCYYVIYLTYHPRAYEMLYETLRFGSRRYFLREHIVRGSRLWPVDHYVRTFMVRAFNALQFVIFALGMLFQI